MHLKLVRTVEEELAHLNAIDTGPRNMSAPLRTLRRVLKRKS
jgi:hypothetical protein